VAFFLSFLLWPLITALTRRKVPGGLAVVVALLCVAATVGIFGLIIQQSIRSFVKESPKYEQRVHAWAERITDSAGPVTEELRKRENLEKVGAAVADTALSAVGSVVSSITTFALIIIYLLFILTGRLASGDRIGRAFAPDRAVKVRRALANVDRQVLRYLGMKTLINLATGFLFAITAMVLGIDFPILWGFLGFAISYVPTIGSVISPVPPILLALLQYPDELWRPLALGIALITIVVVMFNLVEPKVMGDSLGLSPLVVMFALLFFGWMWGVWGMVLSVPLAAIIKIICENFEATRPVAVFME
jgi:AI-2 transport protein TqsA